jgi:hypothetical protein
MELSRRSTAAGFCEAFAKYFAGGLRRDTGRRNQTVARVLGQNWRLARRKCRQRRTAASRVTFAANWLLCARFKFALVAQLDRASDFESEGREFESLRARQNLAHIVVVAFSLGLTIGYQPCFTVLARAFCRPLSGNAGLEKRMDEARRRQGEAVCSTASRERRI